MGAKVVAIVDTPRAPAAEGAAAILTFGTTSPGFFPSLTAWTALVQSLAATLYVRAGKEGKAQLRRTVAELAYAHTGFFTSAPAEELATLLVGHAPAMMQGLPMSLGMTALIAVGNIRIIVTTACGSADDPAFLDLHGIKMMRCRCVLCVKAKNHFRAAFGSICPVMIDIDAPGPAALDIASFPFRLPSQHLHPLQARTE